MKRFLAFFLALVLAISLAACNKPAAIAPWDGLKNTETGAVIYLGMTQKMVELLLGEGTEYDSGERLRDYLKETNPEDFDNAVTNDVTNSEEEYLAGTEEIQIYSNADADESILECFYGEGSNYIEITYRDSVVIGLAATTMRYDAAPVDHSNWADQYGIAPGADKALMIEKYGEGYELKALPMEDGTEYAVREYYFDKDGTPLEEYSNSPFMILFGVNDSTGIAHSISISDISDSSGMTPADDTDDGGEPLAETPAPAGE